LCDRGAALDAQDIAGRTVLHYALAAQKLPIASYLLQKGARVDLRDSTNQDALAYAARTQDWTLLESMLLKSSKRAWDFAGRSALQQAITSGNAERVRLVLSSHEGTPTPEGCQSPLLASQRATLYRDGAPAFRTEISSGKSGYSTPTGQFVVTDKKQSHMSTIYKVKMPFFMRLSCKDFGMHEGYVPDYPASHGCIRVPADAARKLFKEVPIGTLVTITN